MNRRLSQLLLMVVVTVGAGVGCDPCPSGMVRCGSQCAHLPSSSSHCGACGRSCGVGMICQDGTCECSTLQPDSCGSFCADLQSDLRNCGACGVECQPGAECLVARCRCPPLVTADCGGECVDVVSDPANCGGCGVSCPRDVDCRGGRCQCSRDRTHCPDGRCVDLSSALNACGHCDVSCALYCLDGECLSIEELFVGSNHACAHVTGARVVCWGDNYGAQLGTLDDGGSTEPTLVAPVLDPTELSLGSNHTCARYATGRAWCWGRNGLGQLGRGFSSTEEPSPAEVQVLGDIDLIVAGRGSTCVVIDGEVYCFGNPNVFAYGGRAGFVLRERWGAFGDIVSLWVDGFVCAQRSSGAVYCHLAGSNGEETFPYLIPEWAGAEQVAVGTDFACARVGGVTSCYGHNDSGQLGDGTTDDRLGASPVVVDLPAAAVDISAGSAFACALVEDGQVYCWGSDEDRQLAQSEEGDRSVPGAIDALTGTGIVDLECGDSFCCAQRENRQILCWGRNDHLQTGLDSAFDNDVPTPRPVPLEDVF